MTSSLRERKKDRTRHTITRVALELFARDGFHATTINAIAEAADVAPRTVSTYFPSKELIVFDVYEPSTQRVADRFARRSPGESVLDVFRAALTEEESHHDETRGLVLSADQEETDLARLREAAIASDRDLWALQRLHIWPLVTLLARAAAEDLGVEADSLLAQVLGESIVATLLAANARAARLGTSAASEFDSVSGFLRAGLERATEA